jgi:Tfp pilus assembly protein PilN
VQKKKTRNVVIQLLDRHIDVMVFDGEKWLDAQRLPIELEDDPGEWCKAVRRSAVSLKPILEEMNASGATARVLYRSPTQSFAMPGFAVRSPGQAIEAATLEAADSLSFSAMSAVIETAIVARDAEGEERETHVAVVADREDVAEAILEMVEEAGLRFESACPIDAAVMIGLVRDELEGRHGRRGVLYIGTQTSYFVVARDGCLLFSRRIDLGIEALAASLTRPIVGPGGSMIELEAGEAKEMLSRHGVPGRDDVVDEQRHLTGAQIVPLLQPVLQRCVVEIRQSIRFGVGEADREGLKLHVTGPGSALPGLPAVLANELGLELTDDGTYESTGQWLDPSSREGEVTDALRYDRVLDRLNIMPRTVGVQRRRARMRRWAFTGTTAAALIIASDAVRHQVQLTDTRERAEHMRNQIDDLAQLAATEEQLRTVVDAEATLTDAIEKATGLRVNYAACMNELGRITPESVRFESMQFNRRGRGMLGAVTGCAVADNDGANDLEAFMDALRGSPLFAEISLKNVHSGSLGALRGQRFEATFEVVGVPRGERSASGTAPQTESAG